MRISGSNSSILQTIRQPTKLEESSSLVFIYPFIIDKYLERKWGTILRDFFTTQFIAQIKISNVLNITSHATSHGITNNNIEKLENPAEITAQNQALGLLSNHSPSRPDAYQQYYTQLAKQEYQEKINEFRQFIRSQVMIDPRFSDVRPIISNITVENLIDIPLIIGTKTSNISSIPLFWILFFATGQYREDFDRDEIQDPADVNAVIKSSRSLRMDRQQSFEYIKRFIKDVVGANYRNYEQYLDKVLTIPSKQGYNNRVSNTIHSIDTEIDKAIKVFIRATNETMYSDEIGFSQTSAVTINKAFDTSSEASQSSRLRAQNLFTSFLSNYIVPTVQSVVRAVISVDEVNVNNRMSLLTTDLLSHFMGTYDVLEGEIKAQLLSQLDDNNSESSITQLNIIERMCEANSRLSVVQILQEFKNLSFSLTSDTRSLITFTEKLAVIASQLETYQIGLRTNLLSIGLNSTVIANELKTKMGKLHESDQTIAKIFYKFFTDEIKDPPIDPTIDPNLANNRNLVPQSIVRRGQVMIPLQRGQVGPPEPRNVLLSQRLQQFLGINDSTRFIQEICSSLGSISAFMAYYTFFSYLCEYMGEIKAKVEVQRKDALDFPNYCLVFRKEVIEALYGALAAANYKKQKELEDYEKQQELEKSKVYKLFTKKKEEPEKPINSFTNFKIHETDIMQMIRVLNNRLNIPNLIVVDDKTDTVYCKWMYSGGSIMKLTMNNLKTYVQHQQEILTGF